MHQGKRKGNTFLTIKAKEKATHSSASRQKKRQHIHPHKDKRKGNTSIRTKAKEKAKSLEKISHL